MIYPPSIRYTRNYSPGKKMILPFIQDSKVEIALLPLTAKVQEDPAPDMMKEPDQLDFSFENSFESKYLQFKEKIEKDRLAWEILGKKK